MNSTSLSSCSGFTFTIVVEASMLKGYERRGLENGDEIGGRKCSKMFIRSFLRTLSAREKKC
jgi:hypothetical protein